MRKLLLPFSLFYWLGVALRNWFFDRGLLKTQTVTVPVISVGNISAGGAGKTPLVEMLIEKYAPGRRWSVVSRGYGRKSSGTVVVSDGRGSHASVEASGDEPAQLARKFPDLIVVVDEQRVRGAQKAIELGAAVIVLDDGFQHRYLHRDLDLVILSREEILNGDLLLPAGNRREPLSSLNRADVIALSRCTDAEDYHRVYALGRQHPGFPEKTLSLGLRTKLKMFERFSSHERLDREECENKNVILFSGIGNPKSFEDVLRQANVHVITHVVFPDHHWYTENDIHSLVESRRGADADFIITTEKDSGRMNGRLKEILDPEPVLIAGIEQEIVSGRQQFEELVKQVTIRRE
ncbi:MAG: tetraacyldisaccharide 4'-kinase [Ignavibacteriae bacterium]|nr:MAG: tetraacyldisaccharide 4'-kinase [Ignavibacteriota bacterium]